jgi:actin-like ATPase involved in cell morphogenesis
MKIQGRKLAELLKSEYSLIVGENTLADLIRKILMFSRKKIKISGRSYETGRKKTIGVRLYELNVPPRNS